MRIIRSLDIINHKEKMMEISKWKTRLEPKRERL
jgi:hypothetical protein